MKTFYNNSFCTGIQLLVIYFSMVFIPSLFFWMGFKLNFWFVFAVLIFAFSLPLVLQIRKILNLSISGYALNFALALILILLAILFCVQIQDTTYDSNWYHMDAMLILKNGWNPVWEFPSKSHLDYTLVYINHFPKAAWYAGALIFQMTGNPEAEKALNLILFLSVMSVSWYVLFKLTSIHKYIIILTGIIIAANPILLMNIRCTYVDGQVAMLFTATLLFFLLYIHEGKFVWLLISLMALAVLANLKFTATLYSFVIGFFFCVYILSKKLLSLKNLFVSSFFWFLLTFVVIGFNPFITNTIQKGHPLYPLSEGADKFFLKNDIYPANFFSMNRGEKLFYSFFAKPGWPRNPVDCEIKPLFGHTALSFYEGSMPEVAMMGPMAPEIFILLFPLFLFCLFRLEPKKRNGILAILFVCIATIAVNPEAWVMRYIPQFWLIICVMLIVTCEIKYTKHLGFILILATALNCYLIGRSSVSAAIIQGREQKDQIISLRKFQNKIMIDPGRSLTFKNRLLKIGIDSANIRTITHPDSNDIKILHTIDAKYKFK